MGPYAKNPAALLRLNDHLVGCPKDRRAVLLAPVDRRLQALLQQKTAELGITMHSWEIMPHHLHLFVEAESSIDERDLRRTSCQPSSLLCARAGLPSGVAAITPARSAR